MHGKGKPASAPDSFDYLVHIVRLTRGWRELLPWALMCPARAPTARTSAAMMLGIVVEVCTYIKDMNTNSKHAHTYSERETGYIFFHNALRARVLAGARVCKLNSGASIHPSISVALARTKHSR